MAESINQYRIEEHLDRSRGLTHEEQRRLDKLLYKACKDCDIDEVLDLIKDGGKVDYTGEWATPLGIAAFKGHVSIVKELVREPHQASIELQDEYQRTPFLMACWGGNMEIVNFLYAKDTNIKAVDKWGASSIHYGCACDNTDVVQFLLRVKGGFTLQDLTDSVTEDGNTVMHYACLNGNFEVTKWLTDKAVPLTTENKEGETCIFSACRNGNIELIEFLVSEGLSLDALNKNGETCIFSACYSGDLNLLKWLSERGLPLDAPNKEGATCIFNACSSGHLELIKWLMTMGLDLNIPNKNGETAMDQLRINKWDSENLQKRKKECREYLKAPAPYCSPTDEQSPDSSWVIITGLEKF